MTSAAIRQSFLDFFKEKQHTIVPSDNVGYTSRDGAKIFTNAGMNQFVPIFLGEQKADVDVWPGVLHKGLPTRAADTQKCIRAGGKHNDLEDVGLDTYHHTFFEMLGNWSFGDYFKKEAISWAWELVVERWKFPPQRIYATIYQPDKAAGDPAERDEESWGYWAEKFRSVGLDPNIHIVNGNKKDNFWMMADTGPCGPCTEIHVDLTPAGDTKGALVNKGSAECIEIWNNVFIQYNANPDGTFSLLPAKHVDTGMGFERVTSIIQGTKNLTDFANAKISNYDTDIFKPIFDELAKLSGKSYASTLPKPNSQGQLLPVTEQEKIDVAFRVIADHIRTVSFAIADGIQPGNTDRNYTLRRILRRAVKYGRTLGFHEPFFYKLVDVLATHMGEVFPEIRIKREHVKSVLKTEEEAFNRTLDRGMELFEAEAAKLHKSGSAAGDSNGTSAAPTMAAPCTTPISGAFAFQLYDTYGFPLDLTELLARERGLTVDVAGFEALMEQQKARARAAQKKQVVALSEIETKDPTNFVGYEHLEVPAKILEIVPMGKEAAVILDASPFYAEMGGQKGDTGALLVGADVYPIVNTTKNGPTWLHFINTEEASLDSLAAGQQAVLRVDANRRRAIERHHTVTHLFHWALHEVVSKEATQKGSYVGPEKLTFDFNSAALTQSQISDIERLVNERIVADDVVGWADFPYAEVKTNPGVMQLFGEKYGEKVRVVQIGGHIDGNGRPALDGYSMELCGGTHTRRTGEIGLFRIVSEGALSTGIRRVEAIAGLEAYAVSRREMELIRTLASKINSPVADLEKKIEAMATQLKETEKALKAAQQREAAGRAKELLSKAENNAIVAHLGSLDADALLNLLDSLKGQFTGAIVLGSVSGDNVVLMASVPKDLQSKHQAGKIIQTIAPIVGGKGGGKPDFARGGGKEPAKLDAALAEARKLLG